VPGTIKLERQGLERSLAPPCAFGGTCLKQRGHGHKQHYVELTTEQYEIARYIEIITGATNLGDPLTVRVCEAILEDEEAMAKKLIVELPEITSTYLELLLSERRKFVVQSNELWPDPRPDSFAAVAA
jgi:hypothetical protein